jgi:hypothetical protein
VDPNEKTGPAGINDNGFIRGDRLLAYRVDFENESSATAPAQQVLVTDQLDTDVDWSTFELTEVGFGDQLIAVPDNTQYFETTVPMTYNGLDFEVQIEAGIQAETGKVYARFQSIDPKTSLPPDVLTGFLPPEDGTGRGMGHFSYTVNAKADLPTGTEIRNVALISFDSQEIIATNQVDPHDATKGIDLAKECLNTIDAGLPTSYVIPLPEETTESGEFLVQWTGQDDAGGSGVADYSIYVSRNGSPFERWLENTTLTEATYSGADTVTYAFYSVARDRVGHHEPLPDDPDTQTTVVLNRPPTDIALDNASVPENEPTGTLVGRFSTSDPDAGDTFTYALVAGGGDTNTASFEIPPGTRELRTNAIFDFETKSSFTIRVRSTDRGGLGTEKAFTIHLTDVNEAPSVTGEIADRFATENVPFRFVADAGTFTDVDAGDTLSYTATLSDGSPLPAWLSFDSDILTFVGRPTFADEGELTILLQAHDSGTPSLTADTTFAIVVGENPAPWQNPDNRWDVDGSGQEEEPMALDVLVIINYINTHGTIKLPSPPSPLGPPPYVDVDGDGWVRPQDVLAVINFINSRTLAKPADRGEGEAPWAAVPDQLSDPLPQFPADSLLERTTTPRPALRRPHRSPVASAIIPLHSSADVNLESGEVLDTLAADLLAAGPKATAHDRLFAELGEVSA